MLATCYTHDLRAPRDFMDRLDRFEGELDCRWNRVKGCFDLLERDRQGQWTVIFQIERRMPDVRDLKRLERARMTGRSFDRWYRNRIERPNYWAEVNADRDLDRAIGDPIDDNIDFIRGVQKTPGFRVKEK